MYHVVSVTSHDVKRLAEEVTRYMAMGWALAGGLCVDGEYLYQAVYKQAVFK